jgi:hypothetical protein
MSTNLPATVKTAHHTNSKSTSSVNFKLQKIKRESLDILACAAQAHRLSAVIVLKPYQHCTRRLNSFIVALSGTAHSRIRACFHCQWTSPTDQASKLDIPELAYSTTIKRLELFSCTNNSLMSMFATNL